MSHNIYFDTGVFVPLLWDRDPDRAEHCRRVVDDVRGAVRSHDHTAKIPYIVVGEVIARYFRDVRCGDVGRGYQPDRYNLLADLWEETEQLDAEFQSVQTSCHEAAGRLSRRDRELTYNDLYIASSALVDEDATHLIALDSDLNDTASITRLGDKWEESGRRNHPLKVQSSYA